MELLKDVKKILDKYNLKLELPEGYRNVYELDEDEREKLGLYPEKRDAYFLDKYRKYIPIGWYGFAIGSPTPTPWMEALDEILKLLVKKDPEFKIYQIKMKFGGIRFYTGSDVIDDLGDIESLIENKMYSSKLVY